VDKEAAPKKKSWCWPLRLSNYLMLLSVIFFVRYCVHYHRWPSIPEQKLFVFSLILCFAFQTFEG